MANHHGGAAALLLIAASLLAAVALSGADARPTEVPDKTAPTLADAGTTSLTVSHDDAHPQGLADPAATADAEPDCDDDDNKHKKHHGKRHHDEDEQHSHHDHRNSSSTAAAAAPNSEGTGVEQELCATCEQPKEPPPCDCEENEEPELVCKKVHAVRDGETCDSMAKCEELGQDDFLKFNPNICCDHLFVGQWVCLDVECSESD